MKHRVMNPVVILGTALLVCGCASRQVSVKQFGEMHEVLSGGPAQAAGLVELKDVLDQPRAVGVGALAGLEGEITIRDGRAWVARPLGASLRMNGPSSDSSEQAALLTVAYVENWRDVPIDAALSGEALETFIAEQAAAAGIDAGKPFPFQIEGELTDLRLHVINGDCPMRPGAKLAADRQPWRHEADRPTAGTIVGFYAVDSVGKLTHPGTRLHAHALLDVGGREITGHVERLALAEGAVLKLPAVAR